MSKKSVLVVALAIVFAVSSLSSASAAKHGQASKPTGACAQPNGRCISDCDQFNWCAVYTCQGGKSTPVPFWRCYQPSGLCLAPHC
jgi:hypothetical protein